MAADHSFMELLDHHRDMTEIFLSHQEALMALDWDRAEALLDKFRNQIEAHIRFEEGSLLPLYRGRAGERPGGAVALFVGEHDKVKQFLVKFTHLTRAMRDSDRPRRAVLALFDQHTLFKHLMEHHDLREQNVLYPCLDEVTTPQERAALFQEQSVFADSSEI